MKKNTDDTREGKDMINEFKTGFEDRPDSFATFAKSWQFIKWRCFCRGLIEDNSGCIPFICFEAGIVEKTKGHLMRQKQYKSSW
jgi:hypothetical protein